MDVNVFYILKSINLLDLSKKRVFYPTAASYFSKVIPATSKSECFTVHQRKISLQLSLQPTFFSYLCMYTYIRPITEKK